MIFCTAKEHAAWASDYYERDVPVEVIEELLAGSPLTMKIVRRLNDDPEALDIIRDEVIDMGWVIQ